MEVGLLKNNDQSRSLDESQNQLSEPNLLPVLPRVDRLDRLLQILEEKHSLSRRQSPRVGDHHHHPIIEKEDEKEDEDDHLCKTLSSALEEVHQKGTLLDRLATLETRVLQLSMEVEEGNTSRSSSSPISTSVPAASDDNSGLVSLSPPSVLDVNIVSVRDQNEPQAKAASPASQPIQSPGDPPSLNIQGETSKEEFRVQTKKKEDSKKPSKKRKMAIRKWFRWFQMKSACRS